jgi:hypothetical protein
VKYRVHVRGAEVADWDERRTYNLEWLMACTRFLPNVEATGSQHLAAPHATVTVTADSAITAMSMVVPAFDNLRPVTHITVGAVEK